MMATAHQLPNTTSIVPSVSGTMDSYRKGLEPDGLDRAYQLAERIAMTRMCGVTSPEDALVRIMTGRELGLTCMQSIRGIYVVEGRPGLDASLMMALAMQSPECERFDCVEDTLDAVTYIVKRKGKTEQKIRWTMADAHRAKLVDRGKDPSNNNWNKYQRFMLHARCKSEGARREFPDRMFGLLSREEMMDGDVSDAGPPMITVASEVVNIKDAQHAAYETASKALIDKVRDARTKEDKAAVRDEIKRAKENGSLPPSWLEPVTKAYNDRFTAKKDAEPPQVAAPVVVVSDPPSSPYAETATREPGEEG